MTQYEFDQSIQRLKSSFPKAQYDTERLKLIWEKCSFMPIHSFNRIIGNFISGSRYAPLPKDFIDAAMKERAHSGFSKEPAPPTPIVCRFCNDCGVVEVMRKEDGEEFFCNCTCTLRRDREHMIVWRNLPHWQVDFSKDFILHEMYGERALRWKPEQFSSQDIQSSISRMREAWIKKVRVSEEMWRTHGKSEELEDLTKAFR